jgi:hypothetical protein
MLSARGAPTPAHFSARKHRVHFLEGDAVDVNAIRFAGATLWTPDDSRFAPSVRSLAAARADTIFERFESVRDGTTNTSRGSTRISAQSWTRVCGRGASFCLPISSRTTELDWSKTLANFELLMMWVVNKPDWSRI